jgi:site-specific DNA recombinase
MTICASYERVSTRLQGQYGFSLGAQHTSLDEFCTANGWHLPEHLRFRDGEDENASGADWDLPDLTKMLEAASRGEFQVLAVPDFDRFARSLTKGLVLEEQLKRYGVRVVFQRVPVEDSPEGQLLKNQLYSFAEYERQKIILRTKMGRHAKASVGKVVGCGIPPFGYRFTYETLGNGKQRVCGLEHEPTRAAIIREALLALRTQSGQDVVDDLNARGITTSHGAKWSRSRLHGMALSSIYTGTWRYGQAEVPVPPLLTDDEAAQIRRAITHRRRCRRGRYERTADDPFLLRGLLVCGRCHRPLQTEINTGHRYYRCGCAYPSIAREQGRSQCALPSVNANAIEAEVWRTLTVTLLNADYLRAGLDAAQTEHEQADGLRVDSIHANEREIAKQRKRLDSLAADLVSFPEGEFRASIRRQAQDIEGIIAKLQAQRAELEARPSSGLSAADANAIIHFAEQIQAGMEHASPADRRQLYQQLQIRGTVSSAEPADPQAVRLGRKHCYRIDWQASIPLFHSGTSLSKRVTLCSNGGWQLAA